MSGSSSDLAGATAAAGWRDLARCHHLLLPASLPTTTSKGSAEWRPRAQQVCRTTPIESACTHGLHDDLPPHVTSRTQPQATDDPRNRQQRTCQDENIAGSSRGKLEIISTQLPCRAWNGAHHASSRRIAFFNSMSDRARCCSSLLPNSARNRSARYSDEQGECACERVLRAAWRAMDGAPRGSHGCVFRPSARKTLSHARAPAPPPFRPSPSL